MAATGSLRFLLAPVDALCADRLSVADLALLQARGVTSAFGLRIVVTSDLGGQFNRVCDAITPRFEPERLWLGVYQPIPGQPDDWLLLDRFPLREARNETCWFYPTHDGHYLSWQRELQVALGLGRTVGSAPVADSDPARQRPEMFNRERIALLWSLLADDASLTCVGLTCDGLRIDWPLEQRRWASTARWRRFSVDSRRELALQVHASWDVSAAGGLCGEGPPV